MPTLWPFAPGPEIVESITWLSDVLGTYSAEQRIRLTNRPRQTFNLSHVLTYRQYERAKLLFAAAGAGPWYMPLWHEKQRVTVSGGAGTITIDTTACDYRDDGYALLWTSDEACEVVTIDTVASGSLTLVGTVSTGYTNAICCPARVAYCPDGMDATRTLDSAVAASCEWHVYDDSDLAASDLYPSYRSSPVITDAPAIGVGTYAERIVRVSDQVDSGIGTPAFINVHDRLTRSLGMSWMPYSPAHLRGVREFLHYLRGRQRAFWLPDWTAGLQVMANVTTISTTVTVLAVGLNGVAETGDIMIQTASAKTFLRYTSVVVSGANEVLTLSAAAGVTIAAADVTRCCLIRMCRLAQDRIELLHTHRGGDDMLTSIMVLCDEVPIV